MSFLMTFPSFSSICTVAMDGVSSLIFVVISIITLISAHAAWIWRVCAGCAQARIPHVKESFSHIPPHHSTRGCCMCSFLRISDTASCRASPPGNVPPQWPSAFLIRHVSVSSSESPTAEALVDSNTILSNRAFSSAQEEHFGSVFLMRRGSLAPSRS